MLFFKRLKKAKQKLGGMSFAFFIVKHGRSASHLQFRQNVSVLHYKTIILVSNKKQGHSKAEHFPISDSYGSFCEFIAKRKQRMDEIPDLDFPEITLY